MTYLPAKKRSSILIISLSILGCALAAWLLFDRNRASAQTVKTTGPAKSTAISVTATGLEPARSVPLYGFNGNNTRGPKWSTPGLMSQIKALHPQIIRYPGGSVSDWWDWKTGWFVNNPDLPQKYRKIPKVDMSLSELKKVVDATGCQVVFTLNMISASLADQMAMLHNAQQMGIPVNWVELGNESNLPKSAGMQKFKSAKAYAQTSQSWVSAIRKNYPNAKVALVGGNTSNRNLIQSGKSTWNSVVLGAAPAVNAIVMHNYALPIRIINQSGIDFQKLYQQFVQSYKTKGFNNLPSNQHIWLTEYNIHWAYTQGFTDIKTMQKYATTWSTALGAVLMTSTETDLSTKIDLLTFHNLTGWTPFSAIETTNKTFNLLPNGIGMQTWLQAAKGMTKMAKINFSSSIKDYQLLGWKFSNGSNQKVILVNLTNTSMAVNLNAVSLPQTISYHTIYSGKNQQTIGLSRVQKKNGTTTKGLITLPPYSITNLSQP